MGIFEPPQRNSGISAGQPIVGIKHFFFNKKFLSPSFSGKFLQQGKYKLPDGSRYFEAQDFYVGARIEVNKFKFVLVDADEYAFQYMEKHDVCPTSTSSSLFLLIVFLVSIQQRPPHPCQAQAIPSGKGARADRRASQGRCEWCERARLYFVHRLIFLQAMARYSWPA